MLVNPSLFTQLPKAGAVASIRANHKRLLTRHPMAPVVSRQRSSRSIQVVELPREELLNCRPLNYVLYISTTG